MENNERPIWQTFTNQKQWRGYIRGLLLTNNKFLWRALSLVYANQTICEQDEGVSSEDNNIGFNRYDAPILTAIEVRSRQGHTTDDDHNEVQRRLPKYWRQIQVEIKAKWEREQEAKLTAEQRAFKAYNEMVLKCRDNGERCGFGICNDCVVNSGVQMKMEVHEDV